MYLISVYLYRKYMKYLTPSPASEQLSQRGVTEDLCSALKWLGALQAASEQQEAGGEGPIGLRAGETLSGGQNCGGCSGSD